MSLLMFYLSSQEIIILTDTLATTPAGSPHLFVSKCAIVPHLEMVVAHTGVALLGQRWTHLLQTKVLARDIEMLDRHVPKTLRDVRDGLTREFGAAAMSSTVFHLGYSETVQSYVGRAYRSERDFEPEFVEPSFRIKPQPSTLPDAPASIEEMISLAQGLRAEQDAVPIDKRVHIGGDLILTTLSNRSIHVKRVHRFDDFESGWTAMNDSLHNG